MNPLASSKCAKRLFLALAAIAGLLLTVGCGSSNIAIPNKNGFSSSNLNGTYVFSTEGLDSQFGDFLAMAGAFTADGKGGISGGTMDAIDPGLGGVAANQAITSGNYSVSSDGRGQVTLNSAAGTFILAFVLTSTSNGVSSHGLISEFDSTGSGSGTLDLQIAVTSLSQLANPYAFNISGQVGTGIAASTGAFALNSSGTITQGIQDVNLNASGSTYAAMSLTGGATLGSGTGPGTIILTSSSFNLTFDFYPIDATHFKVIETDNSLYLAGDVFTQTGASIPNGPMVFTMAGGINGPITVGGLMTSDGSGNFPTGSEDFNNVGTVSTQVSFTGTAAGAAGTLGRVVVNLSSFTPATNWVIYPSTGGLLMLEMDLGNITQGVGYAQTATSFSAGTSVGYGLNLTAQNQNSEIDDIAQFNATTAASSNMVGVLEENDQGIMQTGLLQLTGTYTADSPATGRGSILVPSLGTPLGGLSLEYYVVDSSTVLLSDVDANPSPQVGAGSFELQSAAGAGVAHGAAATPRSMFMVRPLIRPHAAKVSK